MKKEGFWVALFGTDHDGSSVFTFEADLGTALKILKKLYKPRKTYSYLSEVFFYSEPGKYHEEISKEMRRIFLSHINQVDFRRRKGEMEALFSYYEFIIEKTNESKKSVFSSEPQEPTIKRSMRRRKNRT